MFDFDAGKLLIIGVVALIVIGPKDLPRVLRQVGQAVGRLRRMAGEFQGQFMDAMKEADLQDIKDEMTKLGSHADLGVHFDPARDIQKELTQAVTPSSSVAQHLPEAAVGGFELPHLPELLPEDESYTAAAAGYAPMVEDPSIEQAMIEHVATLEAEPLPVEGQKRKIVLRRRRSPAAPGGGDGLRSAARFQNVRPRRHEASDQ